MTQNGQARNSKRTVVNCFIAVIIFTQTLLIVYLADSPIRRSTERFWLETLLSDIQNVSVPFISPPPPFSVVEGQLLMSIHVVRMEDRNIIPRAQRDQRIFIELGANTIYNAKGTFMQKPEFSNVFIVSAEPLLDKYFQNLEVKTDWVQNFQLGEYIPGGKGIILPVAIGNQEGLSNFTVSSVSGCSSMMPFPEAANYCNSVKEVRLVPTITMKTLLSWMGNTNVEFTKIDIQGMDFFAIESAGDQVKLLQRIQLEAPVKTHMNVGVPGCHEILQRLDAMGFRLGTADEARPYAPLEGAYGTPLIYAGGPTSCDSDTGEADIFVIRKNLTET